MKFLLLGTLLLALAKCVATEESQFGEPIPVVTLLVGGEVIGVGTTEHAARTRFTINEKTALPLVYIQNTCGRKRRLPKSDMQTVGKENIKIYTDQTTGNVSSQQSAGAKIVKSEVIGESEQEDSDIGYEWLLGDGQCNSADQLSSRKRFAVYVRAAHHWERNVNFRLWRNARETEASKLSSGDALYFIENSTKIVNEEEVTPVPPITLLPTPTTSDSPPGAPTVAPVPTNKKTAAKSYSALEPRTEMTKSCSEFLDECFMSKYFTYTDNFKYTGDVVEYDSHHRVAESIFHHRLACRVDDAEWGRWNLRITNNLPHDAETLVEVIVVFTDNTWSEYVVAPLVVLAALIGCGLCAVGLMVLKMVGLQRQQRRVEAIQQQQQRDLRRRHRLERQQQQRLRTGASSSQRDRSSGSSTENNMPAPSLDDAQSTANIVGGTNNETDPGPGPGDDIDPRSEATPLTSDSPTPSSPDPKRLDNKAPLIEDAPNNLSAEPISVTTPDRSSSEVPTPSRSSSSNPRSGKRSSSSSARRAAGVRTRAQAAPLPGQTATPTRQSRVKRLVTTGVSLAVMAFQGTRSAFRRKSSSRRSRRGERVPTSSVSAGYRSEIETDNSETEGGGDSTEEEQDNSLREVISNASSEEGDVCRICRMAEPRNTLFSPCRCSGSSKYVHRECLAEWRAMTTNPEHRRVCAECKAPYRLVRKHNMSSALIGRGLSGFAQSAGKFLLTVGSLFLGGYLLKAWFFLMTGGDTQIDWSCFKIYHVILGFLLVVAVLSYYNVMVHYVDTYSQKTQFALVFAAVLITVPLFGYLGHYVLYLTSHVVWSFEVCFGSGILTAYVCYSNVIEFLIARMEAQASMTEEVADRNLDVIFPGGDDILGGDEEEDREMMEVVGSYEGDESE